MSKIRIGTAPEYRNLPAETSNELTTESLVFDSNGVLTAINGSTVGLTVGSAPTDKLGFFGTAPIVRPTVVLTSPDAQDVIDALVALGLIAQADP